MHTLFFSLGCTICFPDGFYKVNEQGVGARFLLPALDAASSEQIGVCSVFILKNKRVGLE